MLSHLDLLFFTVQSIMYVFSQLVVRQWHLFTQNTLYL